MVLHVMLDAMVQKFAWYLIKSVKFLEISKSRFKIHNNLLSYIHNVSEENDGNKHYLKYNTTILKLEKQHWRRYNKKTFRYTKYTFKGVKYLIAKKCT